MDLGWLTRLSGTALICVAACFVSAMAVCAYIAKTRGAAGIKAFAEVVRAFRGRRCCCGHRRLAAVVKRRDHQDRRTAA
ncbi:hypothetical protein [Amycolatopsis samaneae]|uniref:Uncharacterized protein n=1 Tax=Amycolatopsis samaneae TaxID=664691 RepID=A0ABW5GB96_9PSEU